MHSSILSPLCTIDITCTTYLSLPVLDKLPCSNVSLQQFVADRKVDEEIGTTSRFIGDPDDLLPHVMSFGKGQHTNCCCVCVCMALSWPVCTVSYSALLESSQS